MEKTFPTPEVELNWTPEISLEADMAAKTLPLSYESHLNSLRSEEGPLDGLPRECMKEDSWAFASHNGIITDSQFPKSRDITHP